MHRVVTERFAPSTLVLTACSASTIAIGIAMGWLETGACDLAVAGGFDGVSVFVASGFEGLRATTARLPSRPFGIDRDGMCLGEGAALLALARDALPSTSPIGYVTGFGASGDAVHVTAPDRTGAGLARAARTALEHTAPSDIDVVSAHGTATPFNDAAEWKAMVATLGEDVARGVAVHPFKAQIGHTLGAAGALESLAALDALSRGVLPAAVISPRDPETPARLLERTERTTREPQARAALKLSAAFGGANASLVLRSTATRSQPKQSYQAYLLHSYHITEVPKLERVAELTGIAQERLGRADELVWLALAAIGELERAGAPVRGAGIVVGHAYATVDVNDRYFQRVLERGDARAAEARRFPTHHRTPSQANAASRFRSRDRTSLSGQDFTAASKRSRSQRASCARATPNASSSSQWTRRVAPRAQLRNRADGRFRATARSRRSSRVIPPALKSYRSKVRRAARRATWPFDQDTKRSSRSRAEKKRSRARHLGDRSRASRSRAKDSPLRSSR